MTPEQRLACWYAHNELRTLLREWNATSIEVKVEIIRSAIAALAGVPPPDDVQEEAP